MIPPFFLLFYKTRFFIIYNGKKSIAGSISWYTMDEIKEKADSR
ncbi:hypothetical protein CLOBOL_01243 [Enterocloster bolteae ATCC BAA-613]|uniref:Uncharacterized protein n=1 Tax=Enterocloster bolteae (strain ATCC BAA-613 / DSM 15670 / CCUG 46953 / JCM 12243 / WAL 16351) TaxID=411902 RepID=A8RK92_ENTBW|nr:hypothetical protein CLOBOL_01243 [Enterocloster bolteae ATCC BAA-613]